MFDENNKIVVKVFLKSWLNIDREVFVELSTESLKEIIKLFGMRSIPSKDDLYRVVYNELKDKMNMSHYAIYGVELAN